MQVIKNRFLSLIFNVFLFVFCFSSNIWAYEVAISLGSTAPPEATIALGDKSKWPMVSDLSWGPLANLVPLAQYLTREQQEAVFKAFKQQRAIAELTYRNIRWNESQPDLDFLRQFNLDIPYVLVLNESELDSMLTREQLVQLKNRFPDKTIVMNTRSWTRDKARVLSLTDILDAVCIEFMPHNSPAYIAKDVAPFAVWAHQNNKILFLLMPPLPDDYLEDRFVKAVTGSAQAIYDSNKSLLPEGWMASSNIIFVPANYTWTELGSNRLAYVPEDSRNSVLAAAKALFMMRPGLDAGPVYPQPDHKMIQVIPLLLGKDSL